VLNRFFTNCKSIQKHQSTLVREVAEATNKRALGIRFFFFFNIEQTDEKSYKQAFPNCRKTNHHLNI